MRPPLQLIIIWVGSVLLAETLAGLFVRGRYARCWSFTAYVAAVLIPQVLQTAWPATFYTRELWLLKEVLHATLKFAIILELSVRTLRRFPGAFATGARVTLLVVLAVLGIVLAAPAGDSSYTEIAGQLLPRILNGTIWLFVALGAVILWYRIPVEPLHKAILVGFIPYLLVFTVMMAALDSFGWHLLRRLTYVNALAYLTLEAYWLHVVWQPELKRA